MKWQWIDIVRVALLISLSFLFVYALYRRFKLSTIANHMPVAQHAELIALEVAYHPSRVHVLVKVPATQEFFTEVLRADHTPMHAWPSQILAPGEHTLERALDGAADGLYFFKLSTATQRTVRQFRLQRA